MVKKSQRIWIIFAGLFIALVAAFAVPKTEERKVYAAADLTITNAEELWEFSLDVADGNTYSGKTVVLNSDINFSGTNYNWIPIGTDSSHPFQGTFNGNNHVISNLRINGDASGMSGYNNIGLFGYAKQATINDLTIENFFYTANKSSTSYVGSLVGYVKGSTINNCHVTKNGGDSDCLIHVTNSSTTVAGGLVGYLSYDYIASPIKGFVSNCSSECNLQISGGFQILGGLIGQMSTNDTSGYGNVEASNSHATGTVTGTSAAGTRIGGFVGNLQGRIQKCYSTGNVSSSCGNYDVRNGAFSGEVSVTCYIKDCYCTGNITQNGAAHCVVSAFVASLYKANTSNTMTLSNCYSTGNITLSGSISGDKCVGRILGVNNSYYDQYVNAGSNCFYLSTSTISPSSGTIGSGQGTSKTPDQFASGEVAYLLNGSVSGGETWCQAVSWVDNENFPHLEFDSSKKVYRHTTCGGTTVSAYYTNSDTARNHNFNNGFCSHCGVYQAPSSGTGTSSSPYQITNAGQLYWFAAVVNNIDKDKCQNSPSTNSAACAKLMNDITINTDVDSSSARTWKPIGHYNGGDTYKFTGSINGNNKKISGMKVSMSNATWTSSAARGGLIGYAVPAGDGIYDLTIDNSKVNISSTSTINARVGIMGGAIDGGKMENCKVMNSEVTVNETGDSCTGAFVGRSQSSTYINCSTENCTVNNTSTVACYTGGFIGQLVGGSYTGCYSSSSVTATSNSSSTTDYQSGTGGFAGNAKDFTTIENCYATGNVQLTSKYKGTVAGFIGFVHNNTGGSRTINKCFATGNVTHTTSAGSGTSYTGGFAGDAWPQSGSFVFTNCYARGNCTVTSSSSASIRTGGLFANMDTGTIRSCYAVGSLYITGSGTHYAGKLIGSTSSVSPTNCYTLSGNTVSYRTSTSGSYSTTSYRGSNYRNGTTKTAAQFAEGSVTCLLNGNDGSTYTSGGTVWFQNLTSPVDSYPVLDSTHKKVYTDSMCGSSTRYYANNRSDTDGHTFSDGICTSCGKYQACAGEGTSDSPYQISNAGQLYWFACVINSDTNSKCTMFPGYNTSSCGKLTTNITIPEKDPFNNTDLIWTPIGKSNTIYYFQGTFDGNNKTISGMRVSMTGVTSNIYAGLFGFLSGTVQNVGVINSSVNVSGSGGVNAGGLAGILNGTVTNSYSTVSVNATCTSSSYDVRAGGLVGLQNVSGSNISSTYAIGNVTVSGSGTKSAGRLLGQQSAGTVTNSYCLSTSVVDGATPAAISGVTEKTTAEFASGEVTCWLNGGNGTNKSSGGTPWYQSIDNDIGPDTYSLLDSARGRVYISTPCGQSSPEYSNYNRGSYTSHSFSGGFCTRCGAYQPCTGEGTSASPYQIGNAGQLYWFACVVNDDHLNCEDYYATNSRKTNAYGTLTANITIPSGRLWKPIGSGITSSDYYVGTFDGNNKTISNIKVNLTGTTERAYAGFFGYIGSTSNIRNLGVNNIDANINDNNTSSWNYAGGLAGYSYGNISGCHVTGNVNLNGPARNYGGLFGCKDGSVSDCYVDANIVVNYNNNPMVPYAGSLVGNSNTGNIHRCYTKGTISAKACYTGGLVGYAKQDTYINNCYSTVDVTSTYTANSTYTGGLVGYLNLNTGYVLSNSYSIGDVSASSSTKYVGRLVGYKANGEAINSYYLSTSTISSGTVCNEGTSKTASQFASGEETFLLNQGQSINWYQSLDNNLSPHDSYPLLDSARGMVYKGCTPSASSTSDIYYSNSSDTTHTFDGNGFCQYCGAYQACTGEGTSALPYRIGNAGQLYWFAAVVNNELDKCADAPASRNTAACALLTDDIIINEDISSVSARLWMPIGKDNSIANRYGGTFNGVNHTISGMKINITSTTTVYEGLFGYTYSATIQNVGVINSSVVVSGSNSVYAGGLVGNCSSGSIMNSYTTGEINVIKAGGNACVGGLIGYHYGVLSNSYSTCDVTVNVSAPVYAGGLVGQKSTNSIVNSYAAGTVNATSTSGIVNAGGLTGYQRDTISNSYAIGDISVSTSGTKYAGKLVGYKYSGTLTNSYYLSSSSITNEGTGTMNNCTGTIGDTEKTTAEFASGEVTCRLNNSSGTDPISGGTTWYQTLGIDDYPLLDSTHEKVYCGYRCKSSTLEYTNYSENPLRPTANQNHDFEDSSGFCAYCNAYEAPSNGAGTSGNPYQITNAGQLYWFAAVVNNELDKCDNAPGSRNVAACAKLMSDITINDNVYSEAARVWKPVGVDINNSNAYAGIFDGQDNNGVNHTISGMKIDITGATDITYLGLFGCTYNATIQNVGVIDSRINIGSSDVIICGGLVGNQYGGIINTSYSKVNINAITTNHYIDAGGLVGSQMGDITNSYATGMVNAECTTAVYAGGLVGYMETDGKLCNSYATGEVYANGGTQIYAGGLAGRKYIGTIENTYAIGDIAVYGEGSPYVGKIIGDDVSVTNSYYLNTSTVYGTTPNNRGTSRTATEFSNFKVHDELQTYVDANSTSSNQLSSWVQAQNNPEFSWDNHALSTTLSWGNMTFAYDSAENTWSLPEGDEGENIVTFVNGSNGAKLRYNAVFNIASGLSGITGGTTHSSGDVTYQGATWPMVNSAQMVVSSYPDTYIRNTTLTISGTPSGNNFDRTTPSSPMEIGVITFTISG